MTQQKGIFVGWLTPQNLYESVPWRKGDRKLPLFYWVFFWGHQIQWFLFDQWCNQETEDHRLNVRFKIGGFVLMPKTGIASLTHWYSHPWRHQNSKCHLKTSYLRSILAHTQTSPRLSRELPTSSMPHCTTTNMLLWETTSHRHSQAPLKCSYICFLREAQLKEAVTESCCLTLVFQWNHQYGQHVSNNTKFIETEKKEKKMKWSMVGI